MKHLESHTLRGGDHLDSLRLLHEDLPNKHSVSSAVERPPYKWDVAGSIPAPSIWPRARKGHAFASQACSYHTCPPVIPGERPYSSAAEYLFGKEETRVQLSLGAFL